MGLAKFLMYTVIVLHIAHVQETQSMGTKSIAATVFMLIKHKI